MNSSQSYHSEAKYGTLSRSLSNKRRKGGAYSRSKRPCCEWGLEEMKMMRMMRRFISVRKLRTDYENQNDAMLMK
jgi:hypothetical protein